MTGVRFERNASNLGFIGTCNRGAELARGEFVVLLNNDTIVTAGWLDALLDVFARRPDAGPRRRQARLPGRAPAGSRRHRVARRLGVERRARRRPGPARVQLPARGRLLLRRVPRDPARRSSVGLGGFDARYAPAYYEDTDLAFAVRAAGRKVVLPAGGDGRALRGPDLGHRRRRRHQAAPGEQSRDVRGEVVAPRSTRHRPNGVEPALERDRCAARRVLVIDACMLTPDQDSGSVRMLAMLELMIAAGLQGDVRRRQPRVPPAVRARPAAARRRGAVPPVRALGQRRCSRSAAASSTSCVVSRALHRGQAHRRGARSSRRRRWSCSTPSTCTSCARSGWPSSRAARPRARPRGRDARRGARADPPGRRDARRLAGRARRARAGSSPTRACCCCRTSTSRCGGGKPFAEREGLVFIGGFQHPPNIDAVLWYAREVLPRLRERLPGVTHVHRRQQGAGDDPRARRAATSS